MLRLLSNGSTSGIFRLTIRSNQAWGNVNHLSTSKASTKFNPKLQEFMHGRGNKERRDSVTDTILLERQNHLKRIRRLPLDKALVKSLDAQGLGDKKRKHQVYAPVKSLMYGDGSIGNQGLRKTNSGAGGFAVHLTSASKDWPIFKHLLPEIAFAGHSNSGKSTLVNAMVGVLPSKGPAKVSARAGWTDQICFFQLGKKPPVLTLADLPGYGHAVASAAQRRAWGNMMRDYLQNRAVLSRCCILVDCTRGLCRQDKMLVRFLAKRDIPWMVVLTKGDLLDATSLAQCVLAVQLDLAPYAGSAKDRERFQEHMKVQAAADATAEEADEVDGEDDWASAAAEGEEDVDSDEESGSSDSSSSDEDERDIHSEIDDEEEEEWEAENTDVLNCRLVPVHVISSSTGAGVQPLWKRLCGFARADAPPVRSAGAAVSGTAVSSPVREHRLAAMVRGKRVAQDMRARVAPGAPLPRGGRHTREGFRTKPLPIRIATNRRSVRARMEAGDTQDTS